MGSKEDAILEEPDRFIRKIDIEKIKESVNPKKQFLKELEKKFKTTNGLRLWDSIIKDKKLVDALFESKKIQKEIGKGEIEESTFEVYVEKYEKKINNYQNKIEESRKKKREIGEKIKRHKYTEIQMGFLKANKDIPIYKLSGNFNKVFKTKLSSVSLRDKRLRLLGKKK